MAGHKHAGPDRRNRPLADDVPPVPIAKDCWLTGYNQAIEDVAVECTRSQHHLEPNGIRRMKKVEQ